MKKQLRTGLLITCSLIATFSINAQHRSKVDSLFTLLSKAIEDTGKVNLLNAIGYAYTNNNPDSTIVYCTRAKQLASRIGFVSGEATAFNTIGIAYDNLGDFPKSLSNYFTAQKLFINAKNKKGLARNYNDIGIIYYELGKYDSALNYYALSIHLRDSLHDKKSLAAVYSNIGLVYSDLGNKDKALEQILKALAIDEELGNKQGMADSYLNIGELYQSDNIKKSDEFLRKALDLQEQIGDKEGMIYSYDALGYNYRKQYDYTSAMKYYTTGLALAEEIGLRTKIGAIHHQIGHIFKEQEDYDNAFKEYATALQVLEGLGDKKSIADTYNSIGETYNLQGQPDKAITFLNQSLTIATELDLKESMKNNYQDLATAYEKKNDFHNAYENYRRSAALKDSLMSEEKTKAIADLQIQYETQKKDEQISLLNTKNQLQESVNRKQKILRDAFVVGFILLLAVAFLLYSGFRRKQKSNTELAAMNEVIRQQKDMVEETLTELKRSQSQLVQSEKMASLGQLTAGIAHEINNPINFVSANINPLKRNLGELKNLMQEYEQFISEQYGDEIVMRLQKQFDKNFIVQESANLLKGIEEGSKRTAEIVKGLRNFSRIDEEEMKPANINAGIESTLVLLRNKLTHQNIEVIMLPGVIPEINCYPGQLNQVFMNLLTNSIDAIGEEGKIFITTSHVHHVVLPLAGSSARPEEIPKQVPGKNGTGRDDNGSVVISIRDTGKGMSEEVKKKLFDPFFTTKDVGKGTGLGLSISYGIVEKHNGKIEVNSEPGKGTEFIITLPVV